MRRRSPGEPEAERGLSGREFVAGGAALGSAALLSGPLAACGRAQGPPVAVVGAGLAGLTCAYRLRQHGVEVAVYEARADRVGGRCWTARGFADGQIAEHGGEFIDSDHARIRALVRELGLRLEDREAWAKRRSGRYSRLYLDGALRAQDEVFRDYAATLRRLRSTARRTGYFRSYASRDARAFDDLSAGQWQDANLPGGGASLLGGAMREYLAEEFGLDAARLTPTQLLYLVEGPRSGGQPADTDPSDERYHVHGGNDQVPRLLAERLPDDALHLDAPLQALWRRGDGSCGLRLGGIRR